MKCIFSIDVEDWFHILNIPSAPKISEWNSLPSQVEDNFKRLLDLFSKNHVTTTCFFLGWIAEKFPHLVREAWQRGHEIASHGYSHKLVYEMSQEEFLTDARKSKQIIEGIIGHSVSGYRAAGFSVIKDTPWFFDTLIEAGYLYDSSVFPAKRGHGGLVTDKIGPYVVERNGGKIIEFPIMVTKLFGKHICFSGGGYLRLFPVSLIKRFSLDVLRQNRPVIFYIHPREVNPNHPRLSMNMQRKFKSYINLKTVEKKVENILENFEFTTFGEYIGENKVG